MKSKVMTRKARLVYFLVYSNIKAPLWQKTAGEVLLFYKKLNKSLKIKKSLPRAEQCSRGENVGRFP